MTLSNSQTRQEKREQGNKTSNTQYDDQRSDKSFVECGGTIRSHDEKAVFTCPYAIDEIEKCG
ncbi:uncharacterized protein ColSpa_12191 [Colletotrichum spaethianum]|uniref:Uncharacterized protein n=1 Tax=Colletotrichum spaethianum TaxID=700344 RepID=A0AA37PGQ9_9PEZI|nr:uncharacterized protein ColSpa_11869 [Colletotrichum spaethianum]XP_049134360.1 uncharacterized protein ColSpa_12191 [Colletotrichum spaethianum]GKT51688.1 hypothetical protein ColSpa_11869 [Colletotrichum spaethianum]GKT52010.1 hypothetical protein ColSpa_12191 [Colletotrichum spaethianum]